MSVTSGLVMQVTEADGKSVVVASPSTIGYKTWFTGAGDQVSPLIRGGGSRIRLSWTALEARGEKMMEFGFAEPVELHDGEVFYTPVENWNCDDTMNFSVVMPATTVTPAPENDGNCSLLDAGGFNVILPAVGNGTHNVDLTTAVPVPAPESDGYWDVDYDDGDLTVAANPGLAKFNLMDVPVVIQVLKKVPLGNPFGIFDVETYKVQWIHQTWKLRFEITKDSAGAGDVAGWLMLFRKNVA